MILVTGATGNVGSEIARQLVAAGKPFRIYVRDGAKAAQMIGPGEYETMLGDFGDEAAFAAALEGVESVFMVTNQSDEFMQDLKRMAGQVERSDVRRFVMLSAENDPASEIYFLRRTGELEQIVEATGVPWTFIRPDWFMQNFIGLAASGMVIFPNDPGKTSFVDVRDVAEIATKLLTEDGHVHRSYRVTGPEAFTFKGATQRIGETLGRDIPFAPITREQMHAALLDAGYEQWNADMNSEMTKVLEPGLNFSPSNDIEFLIGRKPRSIESFAADHAAMFGGN
uniref:NAD(P)H-binding protein n=1 Tax=uncultured Altererythrobacter sp. TaxID=500840 RepID=UPI00261B7AB4|nr:NAD(P)H-binding protein [uncultured Altererythrobacter sp.]